MILKCISIKQPWVYFIFHSPYWKNVENRSWDTNHRGMLLIHASKEFDSTWTDRFPFTSAHKKHAIERVSKFITGKDFGCIYGAVILHRTFPPGTRFNAWHQIDSFAHLIVSPTKFHSRPPCRGQLKLFDVDTAILDPIDVSSLVKLSSHVTALDIPTGIVCP
jgi:hypothetical protein